MTMLSVFRAKNPIKRGNAPFLLNRTVFAPPPVCPLSDPEIGKRGPIIWPVRQSIHPHPPPLKNAFWLERGEGWMYGGSKHGSIWQTCVFHPILKGFWPSAQLKPSTKITVGGWGVQKTIWQLFSFPGMSQTIVKRSPWGQCPQVLAGTARKMLPTRPVVAHIQGGCI